MPHRLTCISKLVAQEPDGRLIFKLGRYLQVPLFNPANHMPACIIAPGIKDVADALVWPDEIVCPAGNREVTLDKRVLLPMRWVTQGTTDTVRAALVDGCAVSLAGGYIYNCQIYPGRYTDRGERWHFLSGLRAHMDREGYFNILEKYLPEFLQRGPYSLAFYNAGTDVLAGDPWVMVRAAAIRRKVIA